MGRYTGKIQMSGVIDHPLDIYIDLDQETLAMHTTDGSELGDWSLDSVRITGRDDGFTFQLEGWPAWVTTDNDGAFANEVGLRWAPPRLRRLMAANSRPPERHPALT